MIAESCGIIRLLGFFSGLDKLRRCVARSFPVFLKAQPVASRNIYGEGDIIFDRDLCFIGEWLHRTVFRRNSITHCAVRIRCLPIPPLEGFILFLGRIRLIDRIIYRTIRGFEDKCFAVNSGTVFIFEDYREGFKDHCVKIMLFTFLDAVSICLPFCPGADGGDVHLVGDILHLIICFFDPSLEQFSCFKSTCTGIINDLLQFRIRVIIVLDVHCADQFISIIEIEGHTGFPEHCFISHDRIDRKTLRSKTDGSLIAARRLHAVCGVIVAKVDYAEISFHSLRCGKLNPDRLFRLDLAVVFIIESDIYSLDIQLCVFAQFLRGFFHNLCLLHISQFDPGDFHIGTFIKGIRRCFDVYMGTVSIKVVNGVLCSLHKVDTDSAAAENFSLDGSVLIFCGVIDVNIAVLIGDRSELFDLIITDGCVFICVTINFREILF